jgi:two-component system, LytTR family, sensor kinase
MRRAEGFTRPTASETGRFRTRIYLVFQRDEIGLPSFWALQTMGWLGFYILVLLTILPYHRQEEFAYQTICCATLFLASCLLRPVCRFLLQRRPLWLTLEIRAFACCVVAGAAATFAAEGIKRRGFNLVWADFFDDWLQFSLLLFLWCTLYFSIKHWQQATRERERLLRAEAAAREARLSALRYQLNPHFLFNSLNAASTLVLEGDAAAATRMLAQIGELLRTTLDQEASSEIPLSQELSFIGQYLAIEQTRLGSKLRVELSISPETLDAIVPSMLLQPLVENAVKHGVASQVEGGLIRIESKFSTDRLLIEIVNSGPAASVPQVSRDEDKAFKGIGLANTEERLRTIYGNNYRFSLHRPAHGGCEVFIDLPLQKIAQASAQSATQPTARSGAQPAEVPLCAR